MSLVFIKSYASPLVVNAHPIIGEVTYGGSGCPAGAVQIDLGEGVQNNQVGFIFDKYSINNDGKSVARASCSITIPIQVPEGYALVMPNLIIEGFAKLQSNDIGKLSSEVFIAGSQGNIQTYILNSNTEGEFYYESRSSYLEKTPCGASFNLRANTSILLNSQNESGSFIGVDRLQMNLPLNLVSCKK